MDTFKPKGSQMITDNIIKDYKDITYLPGATISGVGPAAPSLRCFLAILSLRLALILRFSEPPLSDFPWLSLLGLKVPLF